MKGNDNDMSQTLNDFVERFNSMCKTERKDFLLRERLVNYESGSSIKTYYITYVLKEQKDRYRVIGLSNGGFWIFRKRFPLLDIEIKGNELKFKGLYTSTIPTATKETLKECLDKYLDICKKLPQNAFIKN